MQYLHNAIQVLQNNNWDTLSDDDLEQFVEDARSVTGATREAAIGMLLDSKSGVEKIILSVVFEHIGRAEMLINEINQGETKRSPEGLKPLLDTFKVVLTKE